MRRLERFTAENGFLLAVEPSAERRAASFFGPSEYRDAVAWLGVPGADGFEVAQHVEHVISDGPEPSETLRRWTWAVFTLRMTDQGSEWMTAVIEPMLPRGWRCEAVGSELFLVTRRFTKLTSLRMWRMLRDVQRALRPALAKPEQTSDLAVRRRNDVRLEITASGVRSSRDRGASV